MTMQEIEIEFKNLLTEKEYEMLLHAYPFPKKGTWQTNYYFETEDLNMSKKGAALRIREKNGTFRLTLKEPHPDGLLETHDVLSPEEARSFLDNKIIKKPNTAHQLEKLGINPFSLRYFGKLSTERRELKTRDCLLVLDYSQYNGLEDYELELEAPDIETGKAVFNEILAACGIEQRTTPNKIRRFFSTQNNEI